MNFIIPTLCITAIIGLVAFMVHEVCKSDVKDVKNEYTLVWVRYWYRGQGLCHKMPENSAYNSRCYLAHLHGCRVCEIEITNIN